jgi:hypothetical protein
VGRSLAVRFLSLILLLLAGTAALRASHTTRVGVRIDPAHTWVGIVRVHLDVSDLWLDGDALEGRYEIRVPLSPSNNDAGTIRLDLATPPESLQANGGLLDGSAQSGQDGTQRTITCQVEADGGIAITIAMPDRTLQFRSRYRTLGSSATEGL